MAKIFVDFSALQDLNSKLKYLSNDADGLHKKLGSAIGRLAWQGSQKQYIDEQIETVHGQAVTAAGKTAELNRALDRAIAEFSRADAQSAEKCKQALGYLQELGQGLFYCSTSPYTRTGLGGAALVIALAKLDELFVNKNTKQATNVGHLLATVAKTGQVTVTNKPSVPITNVPKLPVVLSYAPALHNENVKVLQKQLAQLGYMGRDGKPLQADGHFGDNTLFAVNEFKKNNRLDNTGPYYGKIGNTSWAVLFSSTAVLAGHGSQAVSNYNVTLDTALKKQMQKAPQISKQGKWVNANTKEVLKYMNPDIYSQGQYKYQFLDLSASAGINQADMAQYLKNKGILAGRERTFLAAAARYQVSEVYLAAHSALETGNGTSKLAKGVMYNGVKVYNMYGIGAFDSDPVGSGARYAYAMGWTTPEKAIEGGAKWISQQYINNAEFKQNTLYEMRWNPANPGVHQYATDVAWAVKQTSSIKKMYDGFPNARLTFDIPEYKG